METFLFFLLSFSPTGTTLAQNHAPYATIVVMVDSSAGTTLYLKRFHAPGLDYDALDSARVKSGPIVFHVAADPMKEYEIYAGRKYAAGDIYLVTGDSLVFSFSPSRYEMIFDKMGANILLRDSSSRPKSQEAFYRAMGRRDWDGMCAYADAQIASMKVSAANIIARYPEHSGLAAAMRAAEVRWYYEPRFRYYYKYYDMDSAISAEDQARAAFADSIPWTDPLLPYRNEFEYTAEGWLNLKAFLWKRIGKDTAGVNRTGKMFALALSLPRPARDAAVFSALRLFSSMSPSNAVPFADSELRLYRPLTADQGYVAAFEKKIADLKTRLPGKPAPEFSLPDVSGTPISLKNFRGKTIYLDFWGTWCGPCRDELWDLKNLERKFAADTSVLFVSIGLQYSGSKELNFDAWKKFIADSSLGGVHLYADDQFQNEYVQQYGIQGVPTFILIDGDGNFINSAAPRPSSGKAEDAIREALARKSQ